jgi:hypothetical protein
LLWQCGRGGGGGKKKKNSTQSGRKTLKVFIAFLVDMTQDGGVRMEQLSSHWADFVKFDIWVFFENLPRKFKLR